MANTTTPRLGLTVPTPGSEPGPDYADEMSENMNIIDEDVFSPNNPVTPAYLVIDDDLDFHNVNSAENVKSVELATQGVVLDSSQTDRVYNVLGDLYWNDASGTPVQITKDGELNNDAISVSTWTSTNISSNTVVPSNATYTTLFVNTSFSWRITLPPAANMTPGRIFLVVDKSGTADVNPITLLPTGADTIDGADGVTLDQPYGQWMVVTDGVSAWHILYSQRSNQPNGASFAVSGTINLASTAVVAGNLALHGNSNTTGDVIVQGTLTVDDDSDFKGDVSFENLTSFLQMATFYTGTLFNDVVDAKKSLYVTHELNVSGAMDVAGELIAGDIESSTTIIAGTDLEVIGATTLFGTTVIDGVTTHNNNLIVSGVLAPSTMVQPQTINLQNTLTLNIYQPMPTSASSGIGASAAQQGWRIPAFTVAAPYPGLQHFGDETVAPCFETFAPLLDLRDGSTLTTITITASSLTNIGMSLFKAPSTGGLTLVTTGTGSATISPNLIIDKSTYSYYMGFTAAMNGTTTIRSIKATMTVTTNQFQ